MASPRDVMTGEGSGHHTLETRNWSMKHECAAGWRQCCASPATRNRCYKTTGTWCGLLLHLTERALVRQTSGCPCCLSTHQKPSSELLRQALHEVKATVTEAPLHIRGYNNQGTILYNAQRLHSAGLHWCGAHAGRCCPVTLAERPWTARRRKAKEGALIDEVRAKHDRSSGSEDDGQGKTSPSASRCFNGECDNCKTWGHRRADIIMDESGSSSSGAATNLASACERTAWTLLTTTLFGNRCSVRARQCHS